ncbi:MAG TPA: IPT/TIG domain-containing protein [Terriglobales bacterium]|nr:IPT/TIG domain-containing protein [Terriglobales bacterium]
MKKCSWLQSLLCLGMFLTVAALPARAGQQNVSNWCPYGTCDIANPIFYNVYWDASLSQFDADVDSAGKPFLHHDHIDRLLESLVHSQYFGGLAQYSIASATYGGSLATTGCLAAPSTLDKARDDLGALQFCLFQKYPWLQNDSIVLNVIVPPQIQPGGDICDGVNEKAEHGKYWTVVNSSDEVAFVPTVNPCATSLSDFFTSLTHEMVEGITDPMSGSPTGWKIDFDGEIGDLCNNQSQGFLYGGVTNYWSNFVSTCVTNLPQNINHVKTATACGSGQNMKIVLSGNFGAVPWDLAAKKFGNQTLYAHASVTHGGLPWGAGNFEGLPPDNGTPDVVNFGASGVSWSANTITLNGFDSHYGQTMSNGATAKVSPGDTITVKLAIESEGQFMTTTVQAPAATQVLNLAVDPIKPDTWIFVNKQADVTGTAADSNKCGGVEGATVSLFGESGMVSPGSVPTDASGNFKASYFAPAIAGHQQVVANILNSKNQATADVPVHPVLTAVNPDLGPAKGGQSVTLTGDGFDNGQGATVANFGSAGATVKNVAVTSIAAVTPASPLPGDGDGIVDVVAVVNQLESLGVPYTYVVPGKPYISYKSKNCKDHYIVVTVYDDQAQPVTVPLQFSASYAAYFVNGQWVTGTTANSGTWVQVDKGGPFTVTNPQSGLSATASFPVLPNGICFNIRNITKVDWHIFEKPGDMKQQEIGQVTQVKPGTTTRGGTKRVIWTPAANPSLGSVTDPSGKGGLQVRTVGAQQMRNLVHDPIFLGGGAHTESAGGNTMDARCAGPAFSAALPGHAEDEVVPLGRQLNLIFATPRGMAAEGLHIVHSVHHMWVEDGATVRLPNNAGAGRTIEQSGIYWLCFAGQPTEGVEETPERHAGPAQPSPNQPAPASATIVVPDEAFPGGLLTGVVVGPDDQPVPNTPVEIAGGVPATLTGVVVGEEPQPGQPQNPGGPEPGTPGHPPVNCVSQLQGANTSTPAGAAPVVTDAAGRFALCMAPDAPEVSVDLPGGTKTRVRRVEGRPTSPGEPPSFVQPGQKVDVTGLLRDLSVKQGGRNWRMPAAQAWSPNGSQVITAFQIPREVNPGPTQLSYTGADGRPRESQLGVFRIVRAFLDRAQLRSNQGATFEYTVQFAPQAGQQLCVAMHVGGPVVLVQPPAPVIPVDASGLGKFSGRIRATQVTPGAAVPFELTPNIRECGR